MKTVVIGATGHVGTFLVPRLVEMGHQVVAVSRGRREPYQPHPAWDRVERVVLDREEEERAGRFGRTIAGLDPDVVVDMICFDQPSARHLVDSLSGRVQMLLFCGTIWIHGPSTTVPQREHENRRPFCAYGKGKLRMTDYVLGEARRGRIPAAVFHPGHIVGPGWNPVNPLGNFNPRVFARIAGGETVRFPTLGLETVHHVHAEDVAQIILKSMANWSAAVGEEFHVVSGEAVTLRGYAEAVYSWFGREPRLEFAVAQGWDQGLSKEDVDKTWDHVLHSPNCSIEKAGRHLGYAPRHASLEAVRQALGWLMDHGVVQAS
ncbi:MAG: NAD-dependent epimerase/dehydratase family protein [Spirochaetota bacterium]